MGAKRASSTEIKQVSVWLERQPGVTSVVQGRYTRARHHHPPGFTRVSTTDDKSVHLRVYDKLGLRDLFVHAPGSPLRDRWVAALAAGSVVSEAVAPKLKEMREVIKTVAGPEALLIDRPKPITENAAQLFSVTPELAANWLEHNTRNRALRQRVVNRYAADMKAGRWLVTGDAVSFDRNGAIINGQHRLWAVLEAGITVPMMVAFGLDPGVVAVLDDHLKRSLGDVASIRRPGATVSTIHTAVANMLIQSRINATATDRRDAGQRVSRQEQLDVLDRHWDAIEFAFREAFRSTKLRGVVVAPIVTPVARAFYTVDAQRLREFGSVMISGIPETARDNAAIVLRNLLMREAVRRSRPAMDVIYRKAERALKSFVDGEKLATLYEASTELFPLPEESMPKKKGGK